VLTIKINPIDKIRWTKKALPAIKKIIFSTKEQDRLIKVLQDNDYEEFAEIAQDARKYIPEVKKFFK
jgi:hypothetical protein